MRECGTVYVHFVQSFIFWSFGVAQTAAALVASGVALHVRVDNSPYRMISKHSGGGIMATIYQEVPFCFS